MAKQKIRLPLSGKWKHAASNKATFFVFLGVAATIVLVAFVWQMTALNRTGFEESLDLNRLLKALPTAAVVENDGVLALAQPNSWTVGYTADGRSYLGLVTAGKSSKPELVSFIDLTAYDQSITGRPKLTSQVIGPGASPAIIARMSAGEDTEAVLLATIQNNRVVPMVRIDGGGSKVLGLFYEGFVPDGQEQFDLEDIDGDGQVDAVIRGQYYVLGDGTPARNESASVFLWDGQYWQFDRKLSWAMTARNGLFPEPPEYDGE